MSWHWQPIETAPKDRLVLLWYGEGWQWGRPIIASWDNDLGRKYPKPFWYSFNVYGLYNMRKAVYTKWCELPAEPPSETTMYVRREE